MIITDLAPVTGPGLGEFFFPEDTALFAIGDVHGQADALKNLCAGIAGVDTGDKKRHVVFLGDAVDRGPASVACLDILHNHLGALTGADEVTLLPGNHELLMADAIDEARGGCVETSATMLWLANGGIKVMLEALTGTRHAESLEYALKAMFAARSHADVKSALAPVLPRMGEMMPVFMDALRALNIDPVSFVRAQPSHVRVGDVLCVHAGVTPMLPMKDALGFGQNEHTHVRDHWAWVREPFLASQRGWFVDGPKHLPSAPGGLLVLHGHTVPKKWAKHASEDKARINRIFNRMETNARVCTDFGAGAGVGVGGCLVTDAGMNLMFAPCTTTD
jgi:serine/threonine protein phosphatase 1